MFYFRDMIFWIVTQGTVLILVEYRDKGLNQNILLFLSTEISYFHNHAQCVFPTILTGHWSYISHGIL